MAEPRQGGGAAPDESDLGPALASNELLQPGGLVVKR